MDTSTSSLLVLMFTDLVGSSALKGILGDVEYAQRIAKPHNRIFRKILSSCPNAVERNYSGDGFLATFATVSEAVNAALRFHAALRAESWPDDVLTQPMVRIGIHVGESIEIEGSDPSQTLIASHAADRTARLMGLGIAGQTLLSRHAFNDARQYVRQHPRFEGMEEPPELHWVAHGRYLFKGIDEPTEVFEVGAKGLAPLTAPSDSEKAKRILDYEEEQTLGWRPGIGLTIPHRGGWFLEKKLGEGGFGEVWLARHERTKEPRVFKFCFDSDRLRSFKRELTLFRLLKEGLGDRDDISQLYEVRIESPPFYLESEYMELGNLSQWSETKGGLLKIPLKTRLNLLTNTARAVAAAHSLGIIHKDLKPSNVLIREVNDGTHMPVLADFGIGALVDRAALEQHDITVRGFTETLVDGNKSSRTGTRLYAPPESLVGKPHTIQGDVYALGVMLYQLSVGDLMRPLATGWEADVTDELLREDIATCVHGDLSKRMDTASELADRVQALAQRHTVLEARRHSEYSRRTRERRMRIALAGAVTAAVILALMLAYQTLIQKVRVEREWKQRLATQLELEGHSIEEINQAMEDAERQTAEDNRLAFDVVFQVTDESLTNTGAINPVQPEVAVITDNGGIRIYDGNGSVRSDLMEPDYPIIAVAYSPDGKHLLAGTEDGSVVVWRMKDMKFRVISENIAESVTRVAWLSGTTLIAWSCGRYHDADGKTIYPDPEPGGVIEFESGRLLWSFSGTSYGGDYQYISASADGARLVTLEKNERLVAIYDGKTGNKLSTAMLDHNQALSVCIGPDNNTVAIGNPDIVLWNISENQIRKILKGHTNWVVALNFSSDCRLLVSGAGDHTIRLWSVESGKEIRRLRLCRSCAYTESIGFTDSDRMIIAVTDGGGVIGVKVPR